MLDDENTGRVFRFRFAFVTAMRRVCFGWENKTPSLREKARGRGTAPAAALSWRADYGRRMQERSNHVRYLRIHGRRGVRQAHLEGDVRRHGASRPRRRGAVPRRRKRDRAGASPPLAHRPGGRRPAHGARRRRPLLARHDAGLRPRRRVSRERRGRDVHRALRDRVQRRDLQPPRPPRGVGGGRLEVQDLLRHRGAARGVPGMGRGRARQAPRHVRVRRVGSRGARAVLRARFLRDQAVLLHRAAGRRRRAALHLRIRGQEHPGAPRLSARAQRGGARAVPVLPVQPPGRDVLQGDLQAARRPLAAGARRRLARDAALLAPRLPL